MYGIYWDFLDVEEFQNVVDVVGVKVFSYFLEMFYLLFIIVVFYYILVIGGEILVLFVDREIIGWSIGLFVEVEIIRFCLGFYIVVIDIDGDVFFQYYFMFVGISGGFE